MLLATVGGAHLEWFLGSAEGFLPRGDSYLWRWDLVSLHIISDGLIALAYAAIPFALFRLVRARRGLPFNQLVVSFAVFIIACGATHAAEIWTLWYPSYWLSGALKALTAVASVATAIALVRLLPVLKDLPHVDALRAANEALQESEGRLRALLESAPDAKVIVDDSATIVLVNARLESLFGYARAELIGQPVEVLVPVRFRERHAGHRRGFFDAPVPRSMGSGLELYGLRKDGSEFPVEISLSPIDTKSGRLVSSSIRDITERKAAEARNRALLETAMIVESAPNAMLMIDADGKIRLVNKRVESLFGYDRQELIGQAIELLVPARLRAAHSSHVGVFGTAPQARAMGAGRDLFGQRKDGTEVPVEIGLNPIETKGGRFTLASIIDITERKRAEERFRVLVEAAPSAMIMVDSQGLIRLVNRQVEGVFGYTREELLGMPIQMLVPDRVRESHEVQMRRFSREKRAMAAGREVLGLRKNGAEVPLDIGLTPIEMSDGLFALASVTDITERRRNEDELRRSNAELEQFAYIASHDLQEPLRMVASYTELLSERYRGKLDEKADKYIYYAVDGARRMQQLVADLLAYSRVGSQGKPLLPVDASAALHSVLHVMDGSIRKAEAVVTEPQPLPQVLADEGQLRQLFQNLIGNAIKFRGAEAPRVEVTWKIARDHYQFTVKDNGIGIDMQYAERVFQMFQRLHERTKYEGSGIGLAIVKRIVERHGGTIWFDSVPGSGTSFHFTLQMIPAEAQ